MEEDYVFSPIKSFTSHLGGSYMEVKKRFWVLVFDWLISSK